MPIKVFSGLPGGGKTLSAMEEFFREADKPDEERRPLFVHGVTMLVPGPWQVLEDATRWQDCPDGSLILIDEAWKSFGHLHDAGRVATPEHVLSLAEHRHRGIDFIWTTQDPAQLFPFARKLCGPHVHVVRVAGMQMAVRYEWGELCEDVKSNGQRERGQKTTWMFPTGLYPKFKSAVLHTIKRKLPKKLILIPAAVAGVLLCVWLAWSKLSPDAFAANQQARIAEATGVPLADAAGGVAEGGGRGGRDSRPRSAEAFREALTSRVHGMPWTASMFDHLSVRAEPEIYCAAMALRCVCHTEQGTRHVVKEGVCRHIAQFGVYNPYRKPMREAKNRDGSDGKDKEKDGEREERPEVVEVDELAPDPESTPEPPRGVFIPIRPG